MLMLMAAVTVLLAGALLPLAFDDGDDDSDEAERRLGEQDRVGPDTNGDFLDDPDDPDPDTDPAPTDSGAQGDGTQTAHATDTATNTAPKPDPSLDQQRDPEPAKPNAPSTDVLSDDPAATDTDQDPAEQEPSPDPPPEIREEEREGRTVIHGTEGDDAITVPPRAFVQGGAGSDTFSLDARTAIGDQAEIADFDPLEDRLVVVWDDAGGSPPPEVSLGEIEDAPHLSQVVVDGVVVAHVPNSGGFTAADIRLLPSSEAQNE